MVCWRDKTFCPKEINKECQHNKKCNRVLKENPSLPACYYTSKPMCFQKKEK